MHITIFLAFVAGGVWLLYLERHLVRLGFASYKWKKTEGTIVEYCDDSFTIPGVVLNLTGVGMVRYIETTYTYRYVVDGHHYYSKIYCFGGHSERAEAFYRNHERVLVYYDSKHPEVAVLKRGIQPGALFGIFPIAGAVLYAWLVF